MIKRYTIILFMTMSSLAMAQPVEMPLWNGTIPNNLPLQHDEKTKGDDQGNITHVYEVQTPSITIYRPETVDKKPVPAVIICPGGGYTTLSIKKEGHDVARFLAENGIVGIVLKYRLPNDQLLTYKQEVPLSDALEAVRKIRTMASELNIDTSMIGIMGFSAGGHLASTASVQWNRQPNAAEVKIDFSILIYPVISMVKGVTHQGSRNSLLGIEPTDEQILHYSNADQINEKTPRTFMVHAFDDRAVPILNSFQYIENLRKLNIECEAHFYRKGGHGFGMLPGSTDSWPRLMVTWLKSL